MKTLLVSLLLLTAVPVISNAQGENNICNFGLYANTVIDFNTPVPTVNELVNLSGNQSHWASSVCYPNGTLRFFVRLQYNFFGVPEFYVFDPAGNGIAGSEDLVTDAGLIDYSMPVVIPRPGNSDQYYIFHSVDYGLYYSLLDMSLNGGAGGIDPTEKNVQIAPTGSIFTRLITSVKGCNGTWLVIRSQIADEFYSYKVSASGVDTHKVVSTCGVYPPGDYNYGGTLKASPNGASLVMVGWSGVELFDFERCSGLIKPAGLIDTSGSPVFFPGASVVLPSYSRFAGAGFSPDNSKLYVSTNTHTNFMISPGKLFQFDLNQTSLPAIIASKTLIITNQPSIFPSIGQCDLIGENPLGEIKTGPDGKVYIDNGSYTCLDTAFVPAGFNPGPAFHVLDNPNAAGLACLPSLNRIKSPLSYEFYLSGDGGISYLQNDIIYADPAPANISGQQITPACFLDSLLLQADPDGECLLWDNGSTHQNRQVYESGKYAVSYFKDCTYHTDTFIVDFIAAPFLKVIDQSCAGTNTGSITAGNQNGQSVPFTAIWYDAAGSTIKNSLRTTTDTIFGLPAGIYSIKIIYLSGCDTTLFGTIGSYPAPVVSISPADTTIRYADSILLLASGAQLYSWSPAAYLDTAIGQLVWATPLQPTVFTVAGIDENGCRDTGTIRINIDYTMLSLIPNAFSPNGDGLNDVFKIEGITYQRIKQFRIFNRYGQSVFSTFNPAKGWDGHQNDKPCDVGTYHYLIELELPDRSSKTFKGDVLLIR
jgi:gliding motility-associated-like protein